MPPKKKPTTPITADAQRQIVSADIAPAQDQQVNSQERVVEEKSKTRRGRPKKTEVGTTEVTGTQSSTAIEEKTKGKRGRPSRKTEKTTTQSESAEATGTQAEEVPKAKRGRPKKQDVIAVSDDKATTSATTAAVETNLDAQPADEKPTKAPTRKPRKKTTKDTGDPPPDGEVKETTQSQPEKPAAKRGRKRKQNPEEDVQNEAQVETKGAGDLPEGAKETTQSQPEKSTAKRGRKRKQEETKGAGDLPEDANKETTQSQPEKPAAKRGRKRKQNPEEDVQTEAQKVTKGADDLPGETEEATQPQPEKPTVKRGRKRKQRSEEETKAALPEEAKEEITHPQPEATTKKSGKRKQNPEEGDAQGTSAQRSRKRKQVQSQPTSLSATQDKKPLDGGGIVMAGSGGTDRNPQSVETNGKFLGGSLSTRLAKLEELRRRKDESAQANRKELHAEHQRGKTNPKEAIRRERKKEEAERLLAQREAERNGEDWERKNSWAYSVESVEKWEEKQRKKAERADIAFTDYNQAAERKYNRLINEFKPNVAAYQEQKAAAMSSAPLVTTEDGEVVRVDTSSSFFRDANSLFYANSDSTPSREAVDRVVADLNKQIAKRESYSRQRVPNEDDNITYINERNRRFNAKISRFYDAYTKEIQENFERGTAL